MCVPKSQVLAVFKGLMLIRYQLFQRKGSNYYVVTREIAGLGYILSTFYFLIWHASLQHWPHMSESNSEVIPQKSFALLDISE